MKKKIILISLIFLAILLALGFMMTGVLRSANEGLKQLQSNRTVTENELRNLIDSGDSEGALDAIDEMESNDTALSSVILQKEIVAIWAMVGICILMIIVLLVYVYLRILRPFEKMKEYAGNIAKGDLDTPIKVERGNYFGDFTWAFDNMRREIIKSRTAEKTAIENNKTVIATLSHDIKTPIASIRAYAEAFEANMDSSPEKKQKYLSVLMQKCDEVTNLTNDLFLHSISEMNRLEVKSEKVELISFFDKDVRELFAAEDEAEIKMPSAEELESKGYANGRFEIDADPKRLLQVFENLKNNADKYAKTKVEISLDVLEDGKVEMHFRDFGPGIPDEELPFITGKFYRGKNVGDEKGSGLGLYIVNELVSRMEGKLSLYNKDPGLDVVIEMTK